MTEWFAPKRYGVGSSLPVAWQGWAVYGAFAALILGSVAFAGDRPLILLAIVIPASVLLLLVCAKTTRGGWRWRWGDDS